MAEQTITAFKQTRQRLEAADADLSDSSFLNVNLHRATFTDVNLAGCSINDANLSGTSVMNANLSGVSISDCRLDGMTINGVLATELLLCYQKVREPGQP